MAHRLASTALFAAGMVSGAVLSHLRPRPSAPVLAKEIERALKQGAFEMRYQPIVDLITGRCVAVEALIRWRGPNGAMLGPDLFMPLARQNDLILPISERAIELVARDLGDLLRQHPDFRVGINIEPALLGRGQLARVGERCGLTPLASQIIIEITETGILDDVGRQAIGRARALNARVAIDDFGTGTNGLAQLEELEIDYIKIDKTFVRKIGSRAPGEKLVDAVVTIAKELNAKTIAEGVETKEQASYLRSVGAEFGQGWLFSKPLSAPELHAYLSAERNIAAA